MDKYIHAFNLVWGISYQALRMIDRGFVSWKYAWDKAEEGDFARVGLSEELARKIVEQRKKIDVGEEHEKIIKSGVNLVGRGCEEFPFILKQVADPPFLIYRKGAPLGKDFVGIAIVGTRMPSRYGEGVARDISKMVTECGGVVVSGLAFGIDAVSHRAAVNLGRPTVAVLASGVNHVTPASHIKLADAIIEKGGTVISEYPGDTATFNYRFLARNRIISGLSKATIVIEAKERSGALITARHALDQDRDVYALVGDISRPQARGCLDIIGKDEARPIVNLDNLIEELGFDRNGAQLKLMDDKAVDIVGCLKKKALSLDEISRFSGIATHELMTQLSLLELKKLVSQNRFGKWELTK